MFINILQFFRVQCFFLFNPIMISFQDHACPDSFLAWLQRIELHVMIYIFLKCKPISFRFASRKSGDALLRTVLKNVAKVLKLDKRHEIDLFWKGEKVGSIYHHVISTPCTMLDFWDCWHIYARAHEWQGWVTGYCVAGFIEDISVRMLN